MTAPDAADAPAAANASMRRRLLRGGLAISACGLGLGPGGNARAADSPAGPPRWVVVLLRGAVDGLSVCVPHGERPYRAERPGIALPAPGQDGGVIDLDGRFGLHPALAPLHALWQAGQFAFVQACGQPTSSRSHFEAQDELEAGTPGIRSTPDGWMSRLIALRESDRANNAVRALYSGPVRPRLFSGPSGAIAAALPVTGRGASARQTRPQLDEGLRRLYAQPGQDPAFARAWQDAVRAREQVAGALEAGSRADEQGAVRQGSTSGMAGSNSTAGSISMASAEMQAADRGAPAPGTFPESALRLAQALRADSRLQFAALELGGWDTHANQGAARGQLANRLAPLGEGLALLSRSLGPVWQRTVVTVISEFGRTVRENGSGGTDHGHGNALWLLGGGLAGGRVLGSWPGLDPAARFEGRDLAITTDYRAVLAAVAAQHLRIEDADLARIFPGYGGALMPGLLRG